MTSTTIRPAIALALALALAGCGGGKASFPINGTVGNLLYGGLVLSTNGMDLPVDAGKTTFTFPNSLSYGDTFDVTVKSSPAHETCVVASGGKDTAGRTAAINVTVACGLNAIALGGQITGLTSDGLKLSNGSTGGTAGIVAPAAGATAFALTAVPFGVSYGVVVLEQPTGNTCSVSANGTGVMTDTPVDNIVITCVAK
jgi:hypothetical protein